MRAYYRPRGVWPEHGFAQTSDGWSLAVVHRRAVKRRFIEPVILCHGLANNRWFFEFPEGPALSCELAEAGFDVFVCELRGTGASKRPRGKPSRVTVDDHIQRDVPAIVAHACRESGAGSALWVGHSLGGLVAIASAGPKLSGLVTVGSPVFFQLPGRTRFLLRAGILLGVIGRVLLGLLTAPLAPLAGWFSVPFAKGMLNQRNVLGRVQRVAMANVFAPIHAGVLEQLFRWVKGDTFDSLDGTIDYRERVRALRAPLLVVGGTADELAPPASIRKQFELAGSTDKQLLMFGAQFGHTDDYGHGDLILGRAAATEVHAPILQWLIAHATPGAGASSAPGPGLDRDSAPSPSKG